MTIQSTKKLMNSTNDDPFVENIIKRIEERHTVNILHSYLPETTKQQLKLQYFTINQYRPRFTSKYDAELAFEYFDSVKNHAMQFYYLESMDIPWEDYVKIAVQQSGKSGSGVHHVLTKLDYLYLEKAFRNVREIRNIRLDEALNLLSPEMYSKTPTLKKLLNDIEKYNYSFSEQLKVFLTIRYIESIAYQDTTEFFNALIQELTWMIVAYHAKQLVMNFGDSVSPGKGLYWIHGNYEPEPYYTTGHYTLRKVKKSAIPLSSELEITEHEGEVTVYVLEYPGGTVVHTFPETLYGVLTNLYTAVGRAENRLATQLGFRKAEYLAQHESITYLVKHYDKEEIMALDFRDGFGDIEDLISSGYTPPNDYSLKNWSLHQVLNTQYQDFIFQQQTFLLIKAIKDNSHEDYPVLPLDLAIHIANTPEFEATIQEIETIVNNGEYPEIIEHPDGILEFTGESIKP